ncbi:MAG: OB-fold nucleic acid binding domain-containing protein, partial [Candidatus Zixiibacteriota bacterium]
YLKAHWPIYFMAASLSTEMGNTDRVVLLILESQRLGIEVLPPDVNRSFSRFTVEDGKIRYGLAAVKNVGEGAVEALVVTRQAKGEFKSIFDFTRKMDSSALNRRMVESLVLAGAFDPLDSNRARLFKNVQRAIDWGADAQAAEVAGQASLFGGRSDVGVSEPVLEPEEKWPPVMRLTREKEVLGFYFSGNPLENYRLELDLFSTTQIGNLESFRDGEEVVLSGMIGDIKTKLDKKGKRMAFAGIEDITGRTELVIFSDVFEKSRAALHPEKLVVARGRVSTKEGEKPKLVALEIYSMEEAYLRTPLGLTLIFNVTERALLEKTLPLFEFGGGLTVLNLRLVSPEETIFSSSRLGGFKLSRQLLENLRQLLPPEKVEISRLRKDAFVRIASAEREPSPAYPLGNGGPAEEEPPY